MGLNASVDHRARARRAPLERLFALPDQGSVSTRVVTGPGDLPAGAGASRAGDRAALTQHARPARLARFQPGQRLEQTSGGFCSTHMLLFLLMNILNL